ncbi:hypothetical protein AD940_12475 [Gluconobacter thailandicus]|nr:hypothetical protein AD940_12475 [Gluconobacter thailandicus]
MPVQFRFLEDGQAEQNYYAVVSYQHSAEKLNFQFSPYFRLGRIDYTPDLVRDLVFRMWPNTRPTILQPAERSLICLLAPIIRSALVWWGSTQPAWEPSTQTAAICSLQYGLPVPHALPFGRDLEIRDGSSVGTYQGQYSQRRNVCFLLVSDF